MKVLITSGGTAVPIDPVRSITNKSKGTFGSRLASTFMEGGHQVHFFSSVDGKTPFKVSLDLWNDHDLNAHSLINHLKSKMMDYGKLYKETFFYSYNDYISNLEVLIKENEFDVIILAAAVSDYLVENYSNEKIKSSEEMQIKLIHAQKVISLVKGWSPRSFLVGFKLLVEATNEELIEAARKSIENNKCDLVVANEFNKVQNGSHEILVVSTDKVDISSYDSHKEFYLYEKIIHYMEKRNENSKI